MERLCERVCLAEQALNAFKEVLKIERPTAIERDAALHRFAFTFDAVFKASRLMLYEVEGLNVFSPKGVVRTCHEVGLFDDNENRNALQMVVDRHLTALAYEEALADEIYGRLKLYFSLLQKWLKGIQAKTTA
ncbi:nucleotidyltransferase substrate binding protein (TIGR01987 family) [Scopulibacillus daqui]|uniref:Nucleotidyltransferase substrate binding protein (TIGR01987 family) n=1 Tax=Scopulibacillus daqui TaxID=1469162 RepID=A0ABS2Q2X0_9BACL|nr:nucleotidyltransferase substrate binding protein [Scopulibacillus daqui]MBM7646648.1 nucleotidyltransferase substrate binding protein (TIGR01987 family) [Scopulibacillus daqui]